MRTQLHDEGQFTVRNQIANVPGASVPQPFGGKYRQIQFYIDPVKLEAAQLSPMDVVRTVNDANKILPAGDVRIGPRDYNIYSNSQLPNVAEMNDVPLKAIGNGVLRFGDIGHAEDSSAIQYNIVRVDGQKSVYLPILKQGGNSNTIQIVNGVRDRVKHLLDVPKTLVASVVFDQSQYVKTAVANVLREGGIGLVLTALMILVFLGSLRGTISVLLSIPISCLAAFFLLNATGSTINTMVLGGLGAGALASDRQLGGGAGEHLPPPREWRGCRDGGRARRPGSSTRRAGGNVHHRHCVLPGGISVRRQPLSVHRLGPGRGAGAGRVLPGRNDRGAAVLRSLHQDGSRSRRSHTHNRPFGRFVSGLQSQGTTSLLMHYDRAVDKALARPGMTILVIMASFVVSLALYPLLGVAFFPRTDPGQFVINVKAPTGSRLEVTNEYIGRMENDIREVIGKDELQMIVSNIGLTPDLSSIYTSNSGQHTAFVQVSLKSRSTS